VTTYIAGQQHTGNVLQAERVSDIPREIEWVEPNNAPLVKITKGGGADGKLPIKKRVAINPEFKVLEKQPHGAFTAVTATYTASITALVVDDATPYKGGDLLQVIGGEVIRVETKVATTNTLNVTRSVGPTAAGTIADNTPLYHLGNSKEEWAELSDIIMVQNRARTNYLAIMDYVYGLSGTAQNSEMYGGSKEDELNMEALLEFERRCERAFLWSEPSENLTGGASGNPIRTTGGVDYWITNDGGNVTTATTTFTKAMWLTYIRTGFEAGSDMKVFLASPLLIEMLEFWKDAKLEMKPSDYLYGIRVHEWETGHGTLLIVRDRDLKNSPAGDGTGHGGTGFTLDPKYLAYRYLQNRDLQLRENCLRTGRDGVTNQILAECGLELRIPEAHSKLESVTTYS